MAPDSWTFTVQSLEPVLVAPAEPTPLEFKELADVDVQGCTLGKNHGIWFYRGKQDTSKEGDPAKVIKEALSRALVFYYPFAGRIRRREGDRRPVLECTGEGVLFVEADADVRLQLQGDALLPPIPCYDQFLQNVEGSQSLYDTPILHIQVTRFLCGGFAMAICSNHILADAAGVKQMLNAMAELANGASLPSLLPVWKRDLLVARDPPQISYVHNEFDVEEPFRLENTVLGSYFLRNEDVQTLKKDLPEDMHKATSFDILTACIWRCRVSALGLDLAHRVRVMVIVSGRGRCPEVIPPGYYGNSIAHPAALSTAGELCGKPLSYAVELIRKAKSQMCTEYLRSTADLLAVKGTLCHTSSEGAMLVSDLRGLGLGQLDFGWGDAFLFTPMNIYPVPVFYFPYRNSRGEEGLVVMQRLPAPVMENFCHLMDDIINANPSGNPDGTAV